MLLLVGEDRAYKNIRQASALHLDAMERIAHTPNFPGNYKYLHRKTLANNAGQWIRVRQHSQESNEKEDEEDEEEDDTYEEESEDENEAKEEESGKEVDADEEESGEEKKDADEEAPGEEQEVDVQPIKNIRLLLQQQQQQQHSY